METVAKRLYEGMFLVDSGVATVDWQKVLDEIQRVLDRAGAEVVSLKKWDDRRMSYEINRKSRGTYILVYFNSDTDKISGIERDVQLSEILVRVLILRTDRMSEDDLKKATPLEAAAAPSKPAETEAQPEGDASTDQKSDDVEDSSADKEDVDDEEEKD